MKLILYLIVMIAGLALGGDSARAQRPIQLPRIGILSPGSPLNLGSPSNGEAFVRGLLELGYVNGKTILFERRSATGKLSLLQGFANDLVRLKVSIIIANGPPAIAAAIKATKTIPVVMISSGSPIQRGFVNDLSRPGGNVTGLSSAPKGLEGKRLEMLREVFPLVSRMVVLNAVRRVTNRGEEYEEVARQIGLNLQTDVPTTPKELDLALAKLVTTRPDALIVARSTLSVQYADKIAKFTVKYRIPSMFEEEQFVQTGGFMSYGVNYPASWRRAAVFVDKILKGAAPATLPVEPPQLEFAINLKTARSLGITIPPEILLEANKVIK